MLWERSKIFDEALKSGVGSKNFKVKREEKGRGGKKKKEKKILDDAWGAFEKYFGRGSEYLKIGWRLVEEDGEDEAEKGEQLKED